MDYNKLLEKAREAYKDAVTGAEKRRLESIFPQLKESEDERIRKALIKIVNGIYQDEVDYAFVEDGITYKQLFAWLEKQGKQNNIVEQLTAFAQHLNKRGAFCEDLCMDFEHEAQSFIEIQKNKEL